jgi:hypothetical protein
MITLLYQAEMAREFDDFRDDDMAAVSAFESEAKEDFDSDEDYTFEEKH